MHLVTSSKNDCMNIVCFSAILEADSPIRVDAGDARVRVASSGDGETSRVGVLLARVSRPVSLEDEVRVGARNTRK